ncbi:hypothetical protein SPRG_13373 [Saprolegnia parasitica CBS 223.65]|uniref:Uncharacterized protein n=1 Tax=Saprolegnia parasitica (strain CBS 223.65) TaxID=695850 RepID=A0A067C432_SAPPC|nr:hypothetical protein SPRG_13373 [Saprolegnia parasitica CBS 223.65]KDO21562.1 hypothetical protein SPRG_13373 [Saprolegnia parasitica CBS 223.65]|eukprot:XP_012207739.1 hypothetical protein SPRG_13373 [Saprolegnia parasitica CBS 223.65]
MAIAARRPPLWAAATACFVLASTFLALTYESSIVIHAPAAYLRVAPRSGSVHILFSTSCDQGHRRLLSSTFQHSATRVHHRGPITEIISGCSLAQETSIKHEPVLYYDYHRHFAPSFSPHPVPNVTDDYTPYNKPFGLRHYLQHARPPASLRGDLPFALFDADFVLLAPLHVNTGADLSAHYVGQRPGPVYDTVRDGVAIAHDWGNYMGAAWFRDALHSTRDELCAGLPCADVSEADGLEFYGRAGPPYIMTKSDGERFVNDYCDFVVRARQKFPDQWMVEMYAYSLAAGNHGIKHTIVNHLGGNWPGGEPLEAWDFAPANMANPCDDGDVVLPPTAPTAMHYCQRFGLLEDQDKGYHFYKYSLPHDVMDCNAMLLSLPPPSQWTDVNRTYSDEGKRRVKRHEVWAACSLAKIMNDAIVHAKAKGCLHGYNAYEGLPMNETPARDSAYPRKATPAKK